VLEFRLHSTGLQETAILEAQEDEAESARSKARRRALLSSLEDEDCRGKHDAEGSTDEPGA
jgi:hypothetical protein